MPGPRGLHGRPQRRSSMRLNFAGVPDEDIREGIRRIGRAIDRDSSGLLGIADGSRLGAPRSRAAAGARDGRARRLADVVAAAAPRGQPARGTPAAGSMSARQAGRRAQGRALAGAHGVAALGRAGRRTRCERLGHEVIGDRRRAGAGGAAARGRARRGVHRAARPRRRGRDRAGAAGGDRHPLHRLGAGGVHALHRQGARQVPDARGGHPDARLPLASRERDQRARRRRRRCRDVEQQLGFPMVVKPARGRARRSA